MIQHDPRCDQHHTPRQRCNRRMTPANARVARLAAEGRSNVRDTIATIEPAEPTAFVDLAWNKAAEQAQRAPTAAPSRAAQVDPTRAAALVGIGLAIVAVLVVRRT